MKNLSEFTKEEAKAYKKAKMVEFEEYVKMRQEMGAGLTWWNIRAMRRSWKITVKCLLKDSKEEREAFEEMNRMTADPNFDERAYEEEAFGPYDDDDCYTPEGYYIFADRYDEAAKQRPPIRKRPPTTAEPAGVCTV